MSDQADSEGKIPPYCCRSNMKLKNTHCYIRRILRQAAGKCSNRRSAHPFLLQNPCSMKTNQTALHCYRKWCFRSHPKKSRIEDRIRRMRRARNYPGCYRRRSFRSRPEKSRIEGRIRRMKQARNYPGCYRTLNFRSRPGKSRTEGRIRRMKRIRRIRRMLRMK